MICDHFELYDKIKPDIGSFPSSWTCEKCHTTVAITWYPKLEYQPAEQPEGRVHVDVATGKRTLLSEKPECPECDCIGPKKCSEHCGE